MSDKSRRNGALERLRTQLASGTKTVKTETVPLTENDVKRIEKRDRDARVARVMAKNAFAVGEWYWFGQPTERGRLRYMIAKDDLGYLSLLHYDIRGKGVVPYNTRENMQMMKEWVPCTNEEIPEEHRKKESDPTRELDDYQIF